MATFARIRVLAIFGGGEHLTSFVVWVLWGKKSKKSFQDAPAKLVSKP